jgi:hypothetical protein
MDTQHIPQAPKISKPAPNLSAAATLGPRTNRGEKLADSVKKKMLTRRKKSIKFKEALGRE